MRRRMVIGGILSGSIATGWPAPEGRAAERQVTIGVLTDLSGNYSGTAGPGAVLAARMAAEDSRGLLGGIAVKVISADHQNKPDLAGAIARQWIDQEGVNAIVDLANSAAALAVNTIARDKGCALLVSSAASNALTGTACSPTTIAWTFDNYSIAHAATLAVSERGGRRWFFITTDFAFGHDLEANARQVVLLAGGTVAGSVRHPLGTTDFSAYMLQAQSSGADVVALAMGGQDTTNALKSASEFGLITKERQLVALTPTILDIKAVGLPSAQGLLLGAPFYWDMNEGTRAWSRRFAARHGDLMPTYMQAGDYGVVLHYLKAVAAGFPATGAEIVARMKAMPTDDPLFGKGMIRSNGRKVHDYFLFSVKAPSASAYPWDFYKLEMRIPGDVAFGPQSRDTGCAL